MNNQLEVSSLSTLIDYSKHLILLLQIVAAALAVWLSVLLTRSTEPLATKLAQLHQDGTIGHSKADEYLSRIRSRYIDLLAHVDNVNTAEFSA